MSRWLYTAVFYLLMPLVLLRLLYRAIKAPAYRHRVLERFGLFSAPSLADCIWVHAVSVGETIAAVPLIQRLQQQYPNTPIVVTTMTPTGSERVRALLGDSAFHVYAPYDLPGAIQRFLLRVQPKLLVIMETELWPNTIHYCRQKNIPVVLANARLSAKSAAGYQRLSFLTRSMLANISRVVAQTANDSERFLALGLSSAQVVVSGSIKFDVAIDAELTAQAAQLKQQWSGNQQSEQQRLIILAASTHPGEDEIILAAFAQLLPQFSGLLLVIVPRHPERFDAVYHLAARQFNTQRRSQQPGPDSVAQVFIGDSMGELMLFYGCADIAIIGGSLVATGGHNMLEAAAWGVPLVTGKSDFNFAAISQLLIDAKALYQVADSQALAKQLGNLIADESLRKASGDSGKIIVAENRGALDRLLAVVSGYL
ncbi:lipid IV(A) 3-deoxy-D-manno-octulosonic acid transferase [Oceanicoccus sp. KOV_DT_Chl]|uniref:lipid IV(A) 3-deoxy-D-manno-octulosonic acid transferase n=1 Tax=Oceanicoccus sp. KOV_DT_Chl TaxID=1904639 RepID=UPI000C7E37B5|nr:lipid IV(A) 3-deoxy-D-manno-octulosonic acid transferase [Oceanicoccus sp. KOV_DT_Chl]